MDKVARFFFTCLVSFFIGLWIGIDYTEFEVNRAAEKQEKALFSGHYYWVAPADPTVTFAENPFQKERSHDEFYETH